MPRRKTQEEFVREVKEKYGDEYIVLGTYVNQTTPLAIKHVICGTISDRIPKFFLHSGRVCPNQECVTRRINETNLKKYGSIRPAGNLEVSKKIQATKKEKGVEPFGEKFKQTMIDRHGVENPGQLQRKNLFVESKESFISFIETLPEPRTNYTISKASGLSESYIRHKVLEYDLYGIVTKIGSRGEEEIKRVLTMLDLEFEQEKIFNDLKRMRFDFFIPSLNVCIEFDGKQHFEESWKKHSLEEQKKRDEIKNNFLKEKEIPLLRIPYFHLEQIEELLISFLKNYGFSNNPS